MVDEAATGSAGASDARRHSGGDPGEQSPLQTRAKFLKNWSWDLVVSFNQGACSRGGAQHGFNRETQEATAREWGEKQRQDLSFEQTIEFLRSCHRKAPFLFFNGNTFADIGRQLSQARGHFRDRPLHCWCSGSRIHGSDHRISLRSCRLESRRSNKNHARHNSWCHCQNSEGRACCLEARRLRKRANWPSRKSGSRKAQIKKLIAHGANLCRKPIDARTD
jgi:hypothetical protein